jgi:uncharacterized membrane protein
MIDLLLGLRGARWAALALLLLEICWHAWLAPAPANLFWPSLALAAIPLLPGLWVARTNVRRGVLICGIVCMFYFAHGVAELWGATISRALPALEIVLSLLVIAALGWDARAYKRTPRHDDRPVRGA